MRSRRNAVDFHGALAALGGFAALAVVLIPACVRLAPPIQPWAIPGRVHAAEAAQVAGATTAPTRTVASGAPVVHAVLFYSTSCPHCGETVYQDLPPIQAAYGDSLQIAYLKTGDPVGSLLYDIVVAQYEVERTSIPLLVVGDHVLVGGAEIKAQFPLLVQGYLDRGGAPWPDITGLEYAVAGAQATPDDLETMLPPPVTSVPSPSVPATATTTSTPLPTATTAPTPTPPAPTPTPPPTPGGCPFAVALGVVGLAVGTRPLRRLLPMRPRLRRDPSSDRPAPAP